MEKSRVLTALRHLPMLAAIDIGTNAVRLKIVQAKPDGSFEIVHQSRDAVRPGEGVFETGVLSAEVAERLTATLRRYAAIVKRYDATLRAVATSGFREARNAEEVRQRILTETGIEIEVISGQEEARLIARGVLQGVPRDQESLVIDIGGGSTEVIAGKGDRAKTLWSLSLGTVRLTELFEASEKVGTKRLKLLREYTRQVVSETLHDKAPRNLKEALGSSGTIKALAAFASDGKELSISRAQISGCVEKLAEMNSKERRKTVDPQRADIIVAGAVTLEALFKHLKLDTVLAVEPGLREGLLIDLQHRQESGAEEISTREMAISLGRRFNFEEPHALQVERFALELFDSLRAVHGLAKPYRVILEAAALLHDVGYSVSPHRHHKHTLYIIENSDLPGFTEKERALVARVARYHRRTPPLDGHRGLAGLSQTETAMVQRLAVLLRLADAFDRSREQPVHSLSIKTSPSARQVTLELAAAHPLDLEVWDAQHEVALFAKIFGWQLEITQREMSEAEVRSTKAQAR